MQLFQRKPDDEESSFNLFVSDLMGEGFDLTVFDKNKIKKHLGAGLYKTWKKALRALHYRKIIIFFDEKELRISWPSRDYPDRLLANLARAPDEKDLLDAEKEILELLEVEKEIS